MIAQGGPHVSGGGPALARTEGLSKRYGGVVAVDDVSVSIEAGQIYGVIGPNGAGKSTFVGLLGGALIPSSGSIFFQGKDVSALPASERARLGVGRTYQIPRPFLDMTVEENLQVAQFSLDLFASARAKKEEREQILERTGLSGSARLAARSLPLLRRKRLELARALALRPKLLLLDEVGAGLIDSEITELIELIKSVSAPDNAIVIVEHVIRIVKECCGRLAVLNFGKMFAEGPTAEVLSSDDVAAVYLGASNTAGARVLETSPPLETAQSSPPLLEITGLSAGYGQIKVLSGLNLAIRPGEAVAILGANGAGKTTLANVISGAIAPSAGVIEFSGQAITGLPSHQIARLGIAHCMEGRRIFSPLSVEENLLIAARGLSQFEMQRRLNEAYGLFPALAERRRSPGTSLSGGQQQMLAIGRALMSKPRLVIFDEISLGLAPVMVDRVYEALRELRASGLTMVIVEQDVERALALADRAYVLERGSFALSGSAHEVRNDSRLRHLYLGEPG
ncbi:MAG TPA: ATP-binding cassette domain-containing protein [Beijerinckiaceae bacterium]|nr:ATP-binding cassette domain-containing protein [Beijerinckiaceae bacterium]